MWLWLINLVDAAVTGFAPLAAAAASGIGVGLPEAATKVAQDYDALYKFLLAISVFFFVIVVGGMLFFIVHYRHQKGHRAVFISHNTPLELLWTAIPTVLLVVLFVWGWKIYKEMRTTPQDAIEIRVIGKQWLWQFQYMDGRSLIGKVYVPQGKHVKLVMSSEDVLHDFFIPDFRIKMDVVPGRYTQLFFKANALGHHQVFCAEYCGTAHSGMLSDLWVLDDAQWNQWMNGVEPQGLQKPANRIPVGSAGAVAAQGGKTLSLEEQGRVAFEAKGCTACHSLDGSPKVGPSLKGVFGNPVEFADGSKIESADENYLRESIENSNAKVVKGFVPSMPTYKGQISEAEMNQLVALIKSLK